MNMQPGHLFTNHGSTYATAVFFNVFIPSLQNLSFPDGLANDTQGYWNIFFEKSFHKNLCPNQSTKQLDVYLLLLNSYRFEFLLRQKP